MSKLFSFCAFLALSWMHTVESQRHNFGERASVPDLPVTLDHGMNITLEYRCTIPQWFGIIIFTPTHLSSTTVAFKFTRKCDYMETTDNYNLTINLPKRLAYRPGYNNKVSIRTEMASVVVFVLNEQDYKYASEKKAFYEFAVARNKYSVFTRDPYDRPEAPSTTCPSWWRSVELQKPYLPQCPEEFETFHAVKFPYVSPGTHHGIHRLFPKYKNTHLKKIYPNTIKNPSFTVSLWVYILHYCPKYAPLCSIVQHLTWDDRYMTPLIFINAIGNLHLQVVTADGEAIAYLSQDSVPLDRWCHLVCTFDVNKWELAVRCPSEEGEIKFNQQFILPPSRLVWYEDTAESIIFGGSEVCPAFMGYIGSATVYRKKVMKPIEIPPPAPNHAMFDLELGQQPEMCEHLERWVDFKRYQAQVMLETIIEKKSCAVADYYNFLPRKKYGLVQPFCKIYKGPKNKQRSALSDHIKRKVFDRKPLEVEVIGEYLYENATARIDEEGHEAIPKVIPSLMQASCLGDHDASYLLAVLYNNGFAVRSDEKLSQHYLLTGALNRHPLSLHALAHKHRYGLDGYPQDIDQAYAYLKNAADKAREDRENHKEKDMYAEKVRLTDEDALDAQTDEDGDLFQWFRHQASQGAVHAQRNLARLYFWGSQGIQRNLEKAVEYYKMGAESDDPDALFDYGIVLLKGIGVEKNMTAAMEYLRKAAKMGHMQAINAVGWYELEITKNYTEAHSHFMDSYHRGSPDAAHNLGHMYMNGLMNQTTGPDRVTAFTFFSAGAVRGQVDSAAMVALYNARGHPSIDRNVNLALEWARFVAEHAGLIGRALSKGVKNYRKGNWDQALLYYMLAAETGIEIGCFNLAHLCELNKEYITSYIEKECIWRFYNLSTLRDFQHVDPYAWIKMGDYWWYGCQGKRNALEAALLYGNAALHNDPHALFNLGYLVEEGVYIPDKVWKGLNFPQSSLESNFTILTELYSRCKDAKNSEAYLPCSLALFKIQAYHYWDKYHVILKLSSIVGSMAATTLTIVSLYNYFHQNRQSIASV